MSGVAIIRALLVAHAPLLVKVPETNITAGIVPQATGLPAIGITVVSSVDLNQVHAGPARHVTQRIQVTVLANIYPDIDPVLRLVRAAAADKIGTIAGFTGVAVHTAGEGPDLDGETGTVSRSQDFMVSFNEAT